MRQVPFVVRDMPPTEVFGTIYEHKIVMYQPESYLLDYPAVYLSRFTYKTGERYAGSLQRFSNYLAEQVYLYDKEVLLTWWLYIDLSKIREWKTNRILERILAKSSVPSNRHIDRDALDICKFMTWIKHPDEMNISWARWDGSKKTIVTKSHSLETNMLKGMVGPRTREVFSGDTLVQIHTDEDAVPIEGFADSIQDKPFAYLEIDQFRFVCNAFPDVVYKFIAMTGSITGVRTHEVLAIPRQVRYNDGSSFTAEPHQIRRLVAEIEKYNLSNKEEIDRRNEQHINAENKFTSVPKLKGMMLKVLGKRQKLREVQVNLDSWLMIMEAWWPIYNARKKLYEAKYGEIPLKYLWLNKKGEPIYCNPLDPKKHKAMTGKVQSAFSYVSNRFSLQERFGFKVRYYCIRHTYATNFVLDLMRHKPQTSEQEWLNDIRARTFLARQMGHSSIQTTYASYIHYAILLREELKQEPGNRQLDVINAVLKAVESDIQKNKTKKRIALQPAAIEKESN